MQQDTLSQLKEMLCVGPVIALYLSQIAFSAGALIFKGKTYCILNIIET